MGRRWKPSKSRAREFAKRMDEIQAYCDENGIDYSSTMDSYYFHVGGESWRVSNHTVAASNAAAYVDGVQVRPKYHHGSYDHEITASKTRIVEIYEAALRGEKMDRRGRVVSG